MARVFGSAKRRFGDAGERIAERFLRRKGYRIIGRNVTTGRVGELDLVAVHVGTLVFVEVKTRRTAAYGTPEEAVTEAKLERLSRAIQWYLQRKGLERVRYRLDVVAVDLTGPEPEIRHLEGMGLS